MRIAIIGSGSVGSALGQRWSELGHSVVFGVRNPDSTSARDAIAAAGGESTARPPSEAASGAEVVVLALPWEAAESTAASLPLDGKIVIDPTNPLRPDLAGLTLGHETSAAEKIQAAAPDAKVVKAFNTLGANAMLDPVFDGRRAATFICGDDEVACQVVGQLAEELGVEVVQCGPLAAARYAEPLAMLWIHLAFARGWGRDFEFGILRR
ncbi:MAG: NADPH-dependent F420 reductase [Phycisphaerales bacterium]|nr:NADPH-dependent F420 reductase [Phycisphaerales bacterium]